MQRYDCWIQLRLYKGEKLAILNSQDFQISGHMKVELIIFP